MSKRIRYSSREDLLLAEAMFEVQQRHGKRPSEAFGFRFPEVYTVYRRKCSRFGIIENVRPQRSIESRMYHVREAFKKRRLRSFFRGEDAMCLKSYKIWDKILQDAGTPVEYETGSYGGASSSDLQTRAYEEEEGIPNHIDEPTVKTNHQQSNQKRRENAKRFLDAFTEVCNERSRIEKIGEETRKRQAQFVQDKRKWEKKMMRTLIQKSRSGDDDNFSVLLENLKDMARRDADLNRQREEKAVERMENDRENWEWEKDTFEELSSMCFKDD